MLHLRFSFVPCIVEGTQYAGFCGMIALTIRWTSATPTAVSRAARATDRGGTGVASPHWRILLGRHWDASRLRLAQPLSVHGDLPGSSRMCRPPALPPPGCAAHRLH